MFKFEIDSDIEIHFTDLIFIAFGILIYPIWSIRAFIRSRR